MARYGSKLCALYRTYRDAETGIAERILTLENRWLKIEAQVNFLHDVWPNLPRRLQIHFNSLLAVINAKLLEATNTLDGTIGQRSSHSSIADIMRKEGRLHRGAFAMTLKDLLDDTIRDLDAWQRNMLDPSWYQLVLIPGKGVSELASQRATKLQDPANVISSLRKLIRANEEQANDTGKALLRAGDVELLASQIEFSESRLALHKRSGSLVVLDPVREPLQYGSETAVDDVDALAKKLSTLDSETFGLLQCLGALQSVQSFDFVFAFPRDHDDPTSLRRLLLDADPSYPLNARINLAQMLARSITFMHTCQLVHKNVRPENIICFSPQVGHHDRPYLIGLERFRRIDGSSLRSSDNLWQRDIYRHPSRQGTRPERDYVMQHDIYSLGVCLLEIGLWRSFLNWDADSEIVSANEAFISRSDLAIKDPRKKAFGIKRLFTQAARERLPGLMGQRYADVVVACLTCLDAGNVDFGDETALDDDDGTLVGVRYVEKVRGTPKIFLCGQSLTSSDLSAASSDLGMNTGCNFGYPNEFSGCKIFQKS